MNILCTWVMVAGCAQCCSITTCSHVLYSKPLVLDIYPDCPVSR